MNVDIPLLGLRANYSIDFMMNGLYRQISAYVAVPALAVTANDHNVSTVQDVTDRAGPSQAATLQLG